MKRILRRGSRERKIPLALKSQIISESLEPGVKVSELALKYGISKQLIYEWRKSVQSKISLMPESDLEPAQGRHNFVELSVIKHDMLVLEKASLVFNNFSFTLEGKIQVSGLLRVLQTLEEAC